MRVLVRGELLFEELPDTCITCVARIEHVVHLTEMRKQPAGPLPKPRQEVRFDQVHKAPGDHDVQGMFDIRYVLARFHRGAMVSAEHCKDASDGVKNQKIVAII